MTRAKMPKRKSLIFGYCRFGLLKDEYTLIDRAAFLEERTKGDFCRIAAVRYARLVLAQNEQYALLPQISGLLQQEENQQRKSEELPFKE